MSVLDDLAQRLGALAVRDAPLGERTTYRVGGTAALLVEIDGQRSLDDVVESLVAADAARNVPILVLGNGSNLLVADSGFPGLCVHLTEALSEIDLDTPGEVTAGGGVAYPVLARRCAAAAVSGMGWAVGIPGTVGGAVAMNAGGHGAETADRLVDAEVVDLRTGRERRVTPGDLGLSYRHSTLVAGEVVVRARFAVEPGERAALEAEVAEIVAWRREHQPGGRNGGSVFTNPPGDSAGRLVEAAGLKGFRVGGAVVSDKHANFIQADPDATAADVRVLIEEVQRLVEKRTGIELAVELRLVGFAP
jgi:UDP-N-acetylmuramate dehydrogenase